MSNMRPRYASPAMMITDLSEPTSFDLRKFTRRQESRFIRREEDLRRTEQWRQVLFRLHEGQDSVPPELPERFVRLLSLIKDEPSLLEANRAIDLLGRAGIAGELDELFRHATDLGLNIDGIAAIILAGILDGPLGTYLPPQARAAVATLREFAGRSMDALGEIGHHGAVLQEVLQKPASKKRKRWSVSHVRQTRKLRSFLDN